MTGIALITGGARGIGRAIVDRLLQDGWTVALTHVPGVEPPGPLEAAFAGNGVTLHPLDLRFPASIAACLADVSARHGGIAGPAWCGDRRLDGSGRPPRPDQRNQALAPTPLPHSGFSCMAPAI